MGIQAPERHATGRLLTGQVGYLLCGIKDLKAARVGDTMFAGTPTGAVGPTPPPPPRLPGFRSAKAMVFAGLFPLGGDGQEFESLAVAMDKLLLNDARCGNTTMDESDDCWVGKGSPLRGRTSKRL